MTLFQAVVLMNHHQAEVLKFEAEQVVPRKLKAHGLPTKQHGSAVRAEHEFFGEVCDALAGIPEVLVTGSHTAQADFKHCVAKHRAAPAPHLVGYETVDHPSENQLVALARAFFLKHGRMAGVPTPS